MEAEPTAHQQQMVKTRTPRAHPVPRRIERDAQAARECEAVAIVMVLGERNKHTRQLGRISGRNSAGDRRHEVGADPGIATNVRPEPTRRRTGTRTRQIMPTPRAPAEGGVPGEPRLRALARGTQVNQATTMTGTPLDRGQIPQERIPARAALAAHPRVADRAPTPSQSKNPPGREKLAQGAQGQPLKIALQRQAFESGRNGARGGAHAVEPHAAPSEHGVTGRTAE